MKRKLAVGWILALVLMLFTITAVAAVLLTCTEMIEQFAVPMAQRNDGEGYTQESYTHEELVQLIQMLNENGITLDEDSKIMKALECGQGYWEEEVLMELCRKAFGGNFSTWSIEEKHWFDSMTVKIGFKEKNPYRIPSEDDMTIPEAKAYAVKLLKEAYGVELPTESDEKWMLGEWFYESWTDMDGVHPATWEFEYVNRKTHVTEYLVSFDREGNLVDSSEAGFHGEVSRFDSFDLAERYYRDQYGPRSGWPLEAWAEFADAIADVQPESANQWCYINAGYRLPPEGAISDDQAISIAMQRMTLTSETETMVICCTSHDRPIYKVRLSLRFPGHEASASYDAIWCFELDCMTGEILDMWEYTYGPDSKPIRMYVPFSVQESAPTFEKAPATDDPVQLAEKQRQADAYAQYQQAYGEIWYFWPLEAQKDALGGYHDVPQDGEITREAAVEQALNAIRHQVGDTALDCLGEYHVGAICCRYAQDDGTRVSWEIYVTSDPIGLSNGYRVRFDDPAGIQVITDMEVMSANAGNG